ncbi:ribbon-helix-helix protein, CopG family [Candidatus Micrarchaeota archaeon]|nr:ribbon-helix-helix protein, CopG family [Candidatus Micrarchaeota archaeon]
MEIISVSLDDKSLNDLDKLQQKLGYKSRSKLLRSTINSLLNEYKKIESQKGHTDAVIVVTYTANDQPKIHEIVHEYADSIRTSLHQHHNGVCIDIIMVCAEGSQIKELFSGLKRNPAVKSISFSIL